MKPLGSKQDQIILEPLRKTVAEALERKRRLGQYAVVCRDGKAVMIGPDAPGQEKRDETP